MDHREKIRSRRIIHGCAIAGALAALMMAQLPGSDNLILVPIEIIMVIRLGTLYEVSLRHAVSLSFVVGSVATLIGRGISEFLVGWMPIAGNIIDALTAAVVIEFMGWVAARDLQRARSQ
jgi:uncharacterized protein (DUF697 family)